MKNVLFLSMILYIFSRYVFKVPIKIRIRIHSIYLINLMFIIEHLHSLSF